MSSKNDLVWGGRMVSHDRMPAGDSVEHFSTSTASKIPLKEMRFKEWPENAADTRSLESGYRGPSGVRSFDLNRTANYTTTATQRLPESMVATQSYAGSNFGIYDLTYSRLWVNDPIVKTAALKSMPQMISTASPTVGFMDPTKAYNGGYMVHNDTNDIVRASTEETQNYDRSQELQDLIGSNCINFANKVNTFNSANWTDPTELYQTMAGWGQTNAVVFNDLPNGGRRSTGRNDFGDGPTGSNRIDQSQHYCGPCAWCRPGLGVFVPTVVPLPWKPKKPSETSEKKQNSKEQQQNSITTFSENQIAPRRYVDLGGAPPYDKDPASPFTCFNTCGCTDQILQHTPMAVQPNGGIQLLWRQAGTNRCVVSYFDDEFNLNTSFHFEATDVGGIAAYDDGTAVLVSQMECDGPATSQTWSTMNRGVVIRWKGGKFLWGTKLTDPYRSPRKDANDVADLDPTYVEDKTGNGRFLLNMGGAQMKYSYSADAKKQSTIAVYMKITGGSLSKNGNHWGSRTYHLDERTGKILGDYFGCSHDIYGRIGLASQQGEYVHVCADDTAKGLVATAATSAVTGGERHDIQENTKELVQAGWAAARPCSLLQLSDGEEGGYVLAHMSKKDRRMYYEGVLQFFDNKMKPKDRVVAIENKLEWDAEMTNFKIIPYGKRDKDNVFLATWEWLKSPTCCPPQAESRCYGVPHGRRFVLIRAYRENGAWKVEKIGKRLKLPPSHPTRFNPEDDPVIDPSNGDILWATFHWNQAVLHRIKNAPVNWKKND